MPAAVLTRMCAPAPVDYLAQHIGAEVPCTVFTSDSPFFQYWDSEKNAGGYAFSPPTQKTSMSFRDFAQTIRPEGRAHASTDAGAPDVDATTHHYLQQMLVTGMGDVILEDFRKVDWTKIFQWKDALKLGDLTTNLLLVGRRGYVTPCHYDEQVHPCA